MPSDVNQMTDLDLVEKLRRKNVEFLHTFVRMHLSFVLDLSTDERDTLIEKGKYKKWCLFPKKTKTAAKGVIEGAPLTQEGICQAYQLIEFLTKEENLTQEGIFRRTGALSRQQELKTLLSTGKTLDLSSAYNVHDCASVLKAFLADLPEPLLTDAHYPIYCQLADTYGAQLTNKSNHNNLRLLHTLQLLLLLLPPENRILLRDLIILLNRITEFEQMNKMNAESLATLFTPHLVCPKNVTPEVLHTHSQTMVHVVAFMIKNGLKLFDVPPKLTADIRAYFLKEKLRKLSPGANRNLRESVSDGLTINTIYSFVDRELTAQAVKGMNPTELALSQLYEHIQSMPESSKKKKLIKQFNKDMPTTATKDRVTEQKEKFKNFGFAFKKFHKNLSKRKETPKSCTIVTDCDDPGKSNNHIIDSLLDCLKSSPEDENVSPLDRSNAVKIESYRALSPPKSTVVENVKKIKTLEYLTSTPMIKYGNGEDFLTPKRPGRNSMSPITKSTKRMPKVMQETMMTPRSRKPVLVLSRSSLSKKRNWTEESVNDSSDYSLDRTHPDKNELSELYLQSLIAQHNNKEDRGQCGPFDKTEMNEINTANCENDVDCGTRPLSAISMNDQYTCACGNCLGPQWQKADEVCSDCSTNDQILVDCSFESQTDDFQSSASTDALEAVDV